MCSFEDCNLCLPACVGLAGNEALQLEMTECNTPATDVKPKLNLYLYTINGEWNWMNAYIPNYMVQTLVIILKIDDQVVYRRCWICHSSDQFIFFLCKTLEYPFLNYIRHFYPENILMDIKGSRGIIFKF